MKSYQPSPSTMSKHKKRESLESLCPNLIEHTETPKGYVSFMDWAEEHHKRGYRQKKCDGCGLYAIWYLAKGKKSKHD